MQVDRGLILQTQTYNPPELALRRNAVVTGTGTKQIPVYKRIAVQSEGNVIRRHTVMDVLSVFCLNSERMGLNNKTKQRPVLNYTKLSESMACF